MSRLKLPNEEKLYRSTIKELISNTYKDTFNTAKKTIPSLARDSVMGILQRYRPTKIITEFGYFGYDSAAIRPYLDDPMHDHIEIIINDLDEILGYRVYSDDRNSKRYSRALESVNDIEWVSGGIKRMREEKFRDEKYTGGKLINKLEYDENFTISGAADRLTNKDFRKVEATRLDIRKMLVDYELSHLVYERKDLRKPLGTIKGTEGTRSIYSIELPKSRKMFYDPKAFDWGIFTHFMKGYITYYIINNTVYKAAEKFIDWINKFTKKTIASKDIIDKQIIQETEVQLAFRPKELPKYNIIYA